MSEIFVGQSLLLEFTVTDQDGNIVNISAATLVLIFERPDKTTFQRVPTLTTDGLDGKMEYLTVVDTDLDQPCAWRAQGFVTIGALTYPATVKRLTVLPVLPAP